MESEVTKESLKKQLRQEVARFYRRDDRLWKSPVVEMLRDLEKANLQAVFFGGTLRSLLVSRRYQHRPGRPRDVDIVVAGASVDGIRELFQSRIERETRFGGLQVRHYEWQFDVWPLERTWAFVQDNELCPEFSSLPSTTFFNMEAIAVEVWPKPGKARRLFTGDDQFFEGLLTRTLEINREENPYPSLCVIRALVMATALDFRIGPALARYISTHGQDLSRGEIKDVQRAHYGFQRRDCSELIRWIDYVCDNVSDNEEKPIRLPIPRQLTLWPEDDDEREGVFRLHALSH